MIYKYTDKILIQSPLFKKYLKKQEVDLNKNCSKDDKDNYKYKGKLTPKEKHVKQQTNNKFFFMLFTPKWSIF